MTTAPEWLSMRAARRPAEPALRTSVVRWSRAQLLDAADTLACALAAEGVGSGQPVASLLADDAPAVVLMAALRRLGAVLVPLNRRLAPAELRDRLETASADVTICDEAHAELARACSFTTHRIEALMAADPCGRRAPLRDVLDLDEPAMVVFTSGTSGRPKGAVLTYGNLAASAHGWSGLLRPRPTDRWLACLPLFHVAGLAIVTRAERWGVELQVLDRFDPVAVSDALDDGVSHVSLVAAQLDAMLAYRADRAPPPDLRAILLGGGAIPSELLRRARDAGYPLLTTYGMTETGSGVAVGGADPQTLAEPATGRALPGAELRVEPDGSSDGSGEILVRGEMVFAGYVDDAQATSEALQEGWLHTGDIGRIDERGLLRVLDRRDDLIISGGENIYPAEVERVLATHPAIGDVAVVGAGDARWGRVPLAIVVLVPDAEVTDDVLDAYCRARLAGYKVPVRFIQVDQLPHNASGKVERHRLAVLAEGRPS